MSDIREAFEALGELQGIAQGTDSDPAHIEQLALVIDAAITAALQSQTAPAVPDGLIDKIKREIGFANAGAESHKGRAGEQLRAICIGKSQALQYVLSMLAAAPQPDHSPDAGEVEPVGWVKWCNGEIQFVELDGILPQDAKTHGWRAVAIAHPAQPRNEVQAEALEEFANDMKGLAERNRNLKTAGGVLVASQEAEAKAKRLRGNGGDVS